jgi:hypothetical protein
MAHRTVLSVYHIRSIQLRLTTAQFLGEFRVKGACGWKQNIDDHRIKRESRIYAKKDLWIERCIEALGRFA